MSGLLTAMLGGAIGYLLGALARALGIPGDVRAHDAAIHDRDTSLEMWVADQDYALRRECKALRASSFGAVEIDRMIADAKTLALHLFRDEARRARLDVANALAGEGWPHRLYRRILRNAPPPLTAIERSAPVLDAWRKPSSMAGALTYPDDATNRSLRHAIDTMPVTGP